MGKSRYLTLIKKAETNEERRAAAEELKSHIKQSMAGVDFDSVDSQRVVEEITINTFRLIDSGHDFDSVDASILAAIDAVGKITTDSRYKKAGKSAFIKDGDFSRMVEAGGHDFDSVDSLVGGEVQATFLNMAIHQVYTRQAPYIVGTVVPVPPEGTSVSMGNKYRVYELFAISNSDNGGITKGERLTPQNIGKDFTSSQRIGTIQGDGVATSYVFNLKNKPTDVANYKMKKGVNEVTINGFINASGTPIFVDINDGNISSSSEPTYTDKTSFGANNITTVFNYEAGTITVTVITATSIPTTAVISFSSELSGHNKEDITPIVSTEFKFKEYVPHGVRVQISASIEDLRAISTALGVDTLANSGRAAMEKIAGEENSKAPRMFYSMARIVTNEVIDVTANVGLATTSETYKPIVAGLEAARSRILEDSLTNGRLFVYGGNATRNILTMAQMGTDNSSIIMDESSVGVREIGTLRNVANGSAYPFVYDPQFDTLYPPVVDGTGWIHTIVVAIEGQTENTKQVLSGIAQPLIPVIQGYTVQLDKGIVYEGLKLLAPNKSDLVRQTVVLLKIKLATKGL